jgi:hypothetical protein
VKHLKRFDMEQNEMIKLITDTTSQIQSLKDDAELNNKIIVAQEELIQLQKQAIEVRNQFIAFLESQLKIQDKDISK